MCLPRVNVKIFMKRKSTAKSHQNDKSGDLWRKRGLRSRNIIWDFCLNYVLELKRTYSYHPTCKFKINTIKNEELTLCQRADSRRQVLSAGHTQEPQGRPAGKRRDAVNLLCIGRAKKSLQGFLLHLMEKPKQTFWPTQYFLGLMMFWLLKSLAWWGAPTLPGLVHSWRWQAASGSWEPASHTPPEAQPPNHSHTQHSRGASRGARSLPPPPPDLDLVLPQVALRRPHKQSRPSVSRGTECAQRGGGRQGSRGRCGGLRSTARESTDDRGARVNTGDFCRGRKTGLAEGPGELQRVIEFLQDSATRNSKPSPTARL